MLQHPSTFGVMPLSYDAWDHVSLHSVMSCMITTRTVMDCMITTGMVMSCMITGGVGGGWAETG